MQLDKQTNKQIDLAYASLTDVYASLKSVNSYVFGKKERTNVCKREQKKKATTTCMILYICITQRKKLYYK